MRTTILLCLLAMAARAEPVADFSKLDWLTGCWSGPGLGGEISECWVKSGDDYFTGVFQLQHDGKLSFTEIVALADFEGRPAMRVRHFHPDFKQWDSDKSSYVSFPLLAIEDKRIRFEGLEYLLSGNKLLVSLDLKGTDGAVSTQRFTLEREGSAGKP